MSLTLGVIGSSGQLGRALARDIPTLGHSLKALPRSACDLSWHANKITAALDTLLPVDAIIIAAAHTAVDAAETEEALAQAINGAAVGVIAEFCAEHNIPLVHISTDYVFKGEASAPYKPSDKTDPINAYGRSKQMGEDLITRSHARAAILRTSWVYDGAGKNFMTTMLRLAQSRTELNVVADQVGRPTFAGDLSRAAIRAAEALANGHAGGIYHVSNSGEAISWADFAVAIFKTFQGHIPHAMTVHPIPSSDYPTPAARPSYSVMDISAFERDFDMTLPHWEEALLSAKAEFTAQNKG